MAKVLKPFWREELLSDGEQELFAALMTAHEASTHRENLSSWALRQAFVGSCSFVSALISALGTLGEVHGPVEAAYDLLTHEKPMHYAQHLLEKGHKLPGFGNSFFKGEPDQLWRPVHAALGRQAPAITALIELLRRFLHQGGKLLYPNPALFTAAVGFTLRVPRCLIPWLFIRGRLDGWASLVSDC